MRSDLEGEVVQDLDELRSIAAEWRTLAEQLGNAFVTPEWFLAWQRHYGEGDAPYAVVVRDRSGAVRGVLPLVRRRHGPFRTLRFAGGALGDRFEPAAAPADRASVAAAAGEARRRRAGDWSALVLDWAEDRDPWLGALVGTAGTLACTRVRTTPLPYLDLAGRSWEEYLASRSRNFRGQLGRRRRALERDHEAVFTRAEDPAEIGQRADTLFSLHERRWQARGDSSLATDRRREFLRDFAGPALEAGWLQLWFLEVRGTPVAAWYGWHIGGRYAYFQAGLDPDYAPYSAGFVLLAHTIEEAFAENALEYDFLRGDEEYKRRFTDTSRQASTWVVARKLHPIRTILAALVAGRAVARRLPAPLRKPLERFAKRDAGV